MRRFRAARLPAMFLFLAIAAPPAVAGTVLRLSDASSDETSPDMLDAALVFALMGDTLTLTIHNETPEIGGFAINAVYFNARDGVAPLSLVVADAGWNFLTNQRADGFGRFDYAIISQNGSNRVQIDAGDSLSFIFDVGGDGPLVETDFTTELSHIPPGSHPSLAAAKFVGGPGDDSAFGAVVPEPGTLILLLSGLGLLRMRREPQRHQDTES